MDCVDLDWGCEDEVPSFVRFAPRPRRVACEACLGWCWRWVGGCRWGRGFRSISCEELELLLLLLRGSVERYHMACRGALVVVLQDILILCESEAYSVLGPRAMVYIAMRRQSQSDTGMWDAPGDVLSRAFPWVSSSWGGRSRCGLHSICAAPTKCAHDSLRQPMRCPLWAPLALRSVSFPSIRTRTACALCWRARRRLGNTLRRDALGDAPGGWVFAT